VKSLAIVGGAGRMGQTMAQGLGALADYSVVALVDHHEPASLFGARHVTSLADLEPSTLDVVIEFSSPDSVADSARWCAANGVALVVGVTGLSSEQRAAVAAASQRVGVVIASNFSLGAALAQRFATLAASHFERVEIIELHHDAKLDAPSGTSLETAHAIALARARADQAPLVDPTSRFSLAGARGAEAAGGIRIHSVRLPGLVAHQEIHFANPSEGLTIRHDSWNRQSFVAGVALAAGAIDSTPRLVEGIGSLLD
jgi:4-hydroxy-tetrahydrodipicolinate reductase